MPSKSRDDIWLSKIDLSVVFWGGEGVGGDIERGTPAHRTNLCEVRSVEKSVSAQLA
jgi:hypothetical protein